MPDRATILAFADTHGAKQAGDHFGIPAGTVRSWRSRARKRAARQADNPAAGSDTPAGRFTAEARTILSWALRGTCLGCGGMGEIRVPPVTRGGLVIRSAQRHPCPTCGGTPRRIEVVEHPRGAWLEGLAAAGDAGFGWNAQEWEQIQGGNPHPDGYRWSGYDTPGGGQ